MKNRASNKHLMQHRITAVLLGAWIVACGSPTVAMAARTAEGDAVFVEFSDGGEADFTDGAKNDASEAVNDGDMNKLAYSLVEKTEEEARKYLEDKEVARKAAEEKAAEEARKEAEEEAKRKAEEEERKKEEAQRKAEEERLARRQEIVDFALQFEGNPYVYGGTSLTNGADCSGFVMAVFQEFGYELPRVAAAQCSAAVQKSVEEIEPGDLVFYGDYGIDHVALYIGDGKIIHASTAATGIKISDYDYRQPAAVGTYLE